jgi:hypothetical protein
MDLDPKTLAPSHLPLDDALKHALYYPACGSDGRPVQYLGGFIHSFWYVDYLQGADAVDHEFDINGFLGYHIAGRTPLEKHHLAPHGWTPQVPDRYRDDVRYFMEYIAPNAVPRAFATWYILERDNDRDETHGPERISLVYLGADGVAAYQALFWARNSAPEVLAIIRPGHAFGGNYTRFTDENGFLAWVVMHDPDRPKPEYLMHEVLRRKDHSKPWQACWPTAYPNAIERFNPPLGETGLWHRPD